MNQVAFAWTVVQALLQLQRRLNVSTRLVVVSGLRRHAVHNMQSKVDKTK